MENFKEKTTPNFWENIYKNPADEITETDNKSQIFQEKTESDILLETIRERRENQKRLGKSEKITDILTMQAIVCVAIVIFVLMLNLFSRGFGGRIVDKYKEKTNAGLENFVSEIVGIFKN
jgi:uncharacterized membrane protein